LENVMDNQIVPNGTENDNGHVEDLFDVLGDPAAGPPAGGRQLPSGKKRGRPKKAAPAGCRLAVEAFPYGANEPTGEAPSSALPTTPAVPPAAVVDPMAFLREGEQDGPAAAPVSSLKGLLDDIALDDDFADSMAQDDAAPQALRIMKPNKDHFIRTSPTAWKNVWLLEIKEGADRGYYVIKGEENQGRGDTQGALAGQ
jgi:hypothetical protein